MIYPPGMISALQMIYAAAYDWAVASDMFACGERVLIEKFLLCKNFSSACYANGGE